MKTAVADFVFLQRLLCLDYFIICVTRLSQAAFKQEHFTLIVNSSFFFKRGIGFYGCKSDLFQVVFHLAKFV